MGTFVYDHLVSYEFLLPLTKEDKLRAALDELFYSDTLDQRVREIGPAKLRGVMPRDVDEADDAYVGRVVRQIAELIGGYSISHVGGRFRATS